ncbi:TonB-dependent siderophore receptor [Flavobacterium franklandianum]|uniref:TonB-dependent siderophore receptor n=1 Tax=Flavobacterium franklandianum TaxID=2594430 RepID=UPI00117A3B45|nr:TonB-dependent siderophore receptor [Flavobacterium franklandianum]TRX23300.1 TonB-dependent siderophore receptor [Flavobacterium franklandianum]
MKHLLLPALLLFLSQFSFAQETASVPEKTSTLNTFETFYDTIKNKNKVILKEIVITTNKPTKPITALRSGLKPMDVPQSIQVVGAEIIEQQQAIRLSEVLKNANGVYVGSARGGAQESFYSRGYDMSANNMFKNGFRYNAGSIPEVSGLEKVEFLKGGSALLFGNVAPGGILNLVTKTPSFKSGGEISMQTGSYSYYKPSADFYGSVNKFIAYRINGSYENSESYRDVVKNERIYINPSLLFNVTNKTQITLQGDYLSADWTPDFGTGAIGKEIVEVGRNSYFGALWSNGQTKSTSASALLNHDFNKNWNLNFNSSFQSYDRTWIGTERIQPNDEKNEKIYGDTNRPLGKNKNLEQIFGNQFSLQGCFKTGSIKHQLFTGADWENSLATGYTFTFSEKAVSINNDGKYVINYYDTINLFSFDPATQRNDIPKNVTNTQIVTTETNRFGVFAQDLISFTEKIKLLAGIRWSWQESQADTNNLTKKTITEGAKRLDNAFSPKLGLVYQPTKDMSIFASYSNSFTPNTGTTANLQPIKPSIIDQYEAGIKKDFWKGFLSTNITVYQITNSNLAQTAEFKADGTTQNTDTSIKTLSGETKSKGVEIDVTARPIEGLNIIAGYSYNDMRYSKTTGANGSFIEGDRLVRTPANTANLSFFYTLKSGTLKGISFGAIGNYIGDRLGGWNNQYDSTKPNGINDREIPLEGYTTLDASVGYNWKNFSILCKLSNITNELNYTVHENYSINPIAPRQIMTSLKYKF